MLFVGSRSFLPDMFFVLRSPQDICKYMKGELKEDLSYLAIRGIISYGIERVELRDEIYCQLIRQTNGCRHVKQTLRAWGIMGLAAVSFSPSRTLLKVSRSVSWDAKPEDYSVM